MQPYCPYEPKLLCDAKERADEFYRQMMESMLENKPAYFITNSECSAYSSQCAKLITFREKQQKQK